ncbi:MAG TPA: hypothetical protein VF116_14580 [Ktedonobacterales bacterium]
MSDPQWPDLSSLYPGGGQQSQDPSAPYYNPQQGASRSGTRPSQPMSPYGSPDEASQYGQQGQYGQYAQPSQYGQSQQSGQYGRQSQSGQYGQYGEYGQYGQQQPSQAPNPYGQPGYQTGAGYPGGPYEQPGAPAYPASPYGQPAAPSQPMYPYPPDDPTMQSTPFSRPLAPAPSQPLYPYGQPGAPSQSLAPYGEFGPPSRGLAPVGAPAKRKRSLTWLWITLGVLVVLLAAGGGGAVYVVGQLAAPATAAKTFCNDLKAQGYDAAYSMLSSALRTQYTHDQFVQGSQALDQIEGQVTACQPSTSGGGYHYSFGANTASVAASISRNKETTSLTGTLRLKSEGGSWKVSGIDTSLLGVNLGALQTANTFCSALQNKDYATATGLFDSSLHVAQADWATWDQIGGAIKSCALQGLGTGNTDSAASFEIAVARANSGSQTGALALALESGAWKVSKLDSGLLGPDLGPLKVGNQFCQDILKGDFGSAFGLLSSGLQQAVGSKDKVAQAFALPAGVYFSNCTAKLSTYKVSGSSGGYDSTLVLSNGSQTADVTMSLSFVQDSSGWKVDDWSFSLS